MNSTKKSYTSPQLVRHGDVDEITKGSGAGFADVPFGNPKGGGPKEGKGYTKDDYKGNRKQEFKGS